MTMPTNETLAKLNALNDWLKVVYDNEVHLSDLLINAGISVENINEIKANYLSEYLDGVLLFLQNIDSGYDATRRHDVMLRHYGLVTGHKETLQSIADEYKVSRERIRQLVEKRLQLLKNKKRKLDFERELVRLVDAVLKPSN
jgi:DNA-directed RNA polymerase sigma subunit (sigma70/sigma32)